MTEAIAAPAAEAAPAAPPKQRGGGPRTPEGKERSKRNALKHGLRARLLLPEELAEEFERRRAGMAAEHRPRTHHQEKLIAQAARAAVLLDRCAELRLLDLGRVQARAEDAWDADRRLEAEELASKLPGDPGRISELLSQTAHGAELMIRYWEGLAEAAEVRGGWDEAQRALAFDLLGTPAALRPTSGELPPVGAPAADFIALAEAWIAALRASKAETLDHRDEAERQLVLAGLPVKEDAVTRRLRRYEAECRRALKWALAEFRRLRPEPTPAAKPAPKPRPRVERGREPSGAKVFGDLMADLMKLPSARPEAKAEAAPAPAPITTTATAPSKPMSRRARKALEKRQRLAARQAAR